MGESLLQLFPIERRDFWKKVSADEKRIQEIRLRSDLPVMIMRDGGEYFLDGSGGYTDNLAAAYYTDGQEVDEVLNHICHYSLYAYEDELRQGFITVAGGHRIGVAGHAVLEADGQVRTLKHISYMNIRVSHQVKGAGNKVLPHLYQNGELLNTLIISPPGCGKTTLLRDLARQVSDGNTYGSGQSVCIVDERSEIAGCYLGKPQNDVGIRTDVLDACPKAIGMMMLLRAMSPKVIAIDELGGTADIDAVHLAASCGSRLLATIHGEDIEDVRHKPGMDSLFQENIFQCFILLEKKDGKCVVKDIYENEKGTFHERETFHGRGTIHEKETFHESRTFQGGSI